MRASGADGSSVPNPIPFPRRALRPAARLAPAGCRRRGPPRPLPDSPVGCAAGNAFAGRAMPPARPAPPRGGASGMRKDCLCGATPHAGASELRARQGQARDRRGGCPAIPAPPVPPTTWSRMCCSVRRLPRHSGAARPPSRIIPAFHPAPLPPDTTPSPAGRTRPSRMPFPRGLAAAAAMRWSMPLRLRIAHEAHRPPVHPRQQVLDDMPPPPLPPPRTAHAGPPSPPAHSHQI